MAVRTEIGVLITSGGKGTGETINNIRDRGDRWVATVPATSVLPNAMPGDLATIYARDIRVEEPPDVPQCCGS